MAQLAGISSQLFAAAADASDAQQPAAGAAHGQDMVLLAVSIVFIALVISLCIVLARTIKKRTALIQEQDAEAELLFEKRMSRETARLNAESGRDASIAQDIAAPAFWGSGSGDPARIGEPPTAPDGDGDRASTIEELGRRLFALRIVTDREGTLDMEGVPGIAYRLRRGGVCAVVASVAGEDVALRLCRRFDMVFVLTKEGDALVYQRLQSRLPDFLSMGEKSG